MDRFWSKVDMNPHHCWEWQSTIDMYGYGLFWLNGANRKAHRIAWILSGRVLIPGMVLDHLCRNRKCVNPDHLEQVTIGENVSRGTNHYRGRASCKNGHDFSPENTRMRTVIVRGKSYQTRTCVTCERQRPRKKAAR